MKKTTLKDRVIERLDMYSLEGPFQGVASTAKCAEEIIEMVTKDVKRSRARQKAKETGERE